MIAYHDYARQEIYIVSLDENGAPVGPKLTVEYPKEIRELLALTGWTPDNKIGVMLRRSSIGEGLYVLPLKGGPATLLSGGLEWMRMPHWSHDGKRIVYSYWVSNFKAGEEEADNGWLGSGTAWMPMEGGEATKIPVQTDRKMLNTGFGGPVVSPDGKTLVFAGKAGEQEIMTMYIWTLPIEGGKPTQLTHAPEPLADGYPCWSPDGKSIAFVRCPDCRSNSTKSFRADIFTVPAAGGEPRQVTSESDTAAFIDVVWSPDGKLLAYFDNDGPTLRVIPAEGGESRIVARLQRLGMYQGLAWSPDSRRIAFNEPPNSIKIVSLEDGLVEEISPGVATKEIGHVDWSRDGDKLVFWAQLGGGEMEFWLMENFLPAK
jgi:Tol biopolymer transport system component